MMHEGEWTSAKINSLIGALAFGELNLENEELIQELYSALTWLYTEHRTVRAMVAEIRAIVAPDTIPTIDAAPFE